MLINYLSVFPQFYLKRTIKKCSCEVGLPELKDEREVFFRVKKGEEVSFAGNLSKVDCWKSIELNTWNLKLKFGGKLVKTILSKFVEGIISF